MKKSGQNISFLEKLSKKLEVLKKGVSFDETDNKNKVNLYNELADKYLAEISSNDIDLDAFLETIPTQIVQIQKTEKIVENTYNINLVENTLLISQSQNKIVLPYHFSEIDEILKAEPNKYKTREDVIKAIYTKPLNYYRHSSFVRFKEAFKLAREKEHTSIKEALELAVELFSNYNLHPAIITACKNLNELDIYLSCLEYNELDDFHFFNVIFQVAPLVV